MSFAQSLGETLGPASFSQINEKGIAALRKRLPSGLAVDRLLAYCGVENPEKQYAPTSKDAFVQLVKAVESGTDNSVYQSRALFYLFLDVSRRGQQPQGAPTLADYYTSQIWMNQPEQALVLGLWNLDHGSPDEALKHLGQPWELGGADALHESIIDSLYVQKPEAVANYLAARGPPAPYSDQLVRSLALRGKFAEVLDIAREQQNLGYLKEITRESVTSKSKSLELAQLACTPEEWQVIQDELHNIIEAGDKDTTLAKNTILVRALHTGDTETLVDLRSNFPESELFIQNFVQ